MQIGSYIPVNAACVQIQRRHGVANALADTGLFDAFRYNHSGQPGESRTAKIPHAPEFAQFITGSKAHPRSMESQYSVIAIDLALIVVSSAIGFDAASGHLFMRCHFHRTLALMGRLQNK